MISEELVEKFLRIEYKYDFFSLEMKKVRFWQYIRFEVYSYFMEYYQMRNNNIQIKQKFDRKPGLIGAYERNIKYNPFVARHKDIIVFSHQRKILENGYYKCLYTNLISKKLTFSHYVFDRKMLNNHYYPQDVKNLKYVDGYRYAEKHLDEKIRADKKIFETKIVRVLETEFNMQIPPKIKKKWINLLQYYLRVRKSILKYYYILFKIVRPRAIVVVVSYDYEMMLVCEMGKRMHIPVIELQHGVIGKEHIAYNYYKTRRIPSFPDYLFTFGDFDKKSARLPIEKSNVYSVGFPELESKLKLKKGNTNKKILLFISQTLPIIAEYASYLAEILDPRQYEIIFKLHPREYDVWEKVLGQYLLKDNITVAKDISKDIYYYLSKADYVISNSSTVLIEATMFDAEIIVLKVGAYTYMKNLYENGYAKLVESKEELANLIEKGIFERKDTSLFARDSVNNINYALSEIINKRRKQK